jgi:lipopolysaccharide transport system permease protein
MSKETTDEESWDVLITAKRKWLGLNFRELHQYKDLVKLMIRREFVSVYKQTIFGPLWFVFQPLMSTFLYMFVFGNIAQMGTDEIPQALFYFSGTMLWTFFATTLQKCSDTFVNNAGLFGKIYFPRFIMPIAYVVNAFFTLLIQFAVLIVFHIYYVARGVTFNVSWWLLATPVYIVQLGLLGIGFGIMISAWTTKYHDLRNLVSFGLSLLMYATPVVYPISSIPAQWKVLFQINPVAPVIEMFRYSLFGKGSCDLKMWAYSLVVSVVVFLLGLMTFNHNEQTFVDVI